MALSFLYVAFVRLFQLVRFSWGEQEDLAIEVVMLRHEVSVPIGAGSLYYAHHYKRVTVPITVTGKVFPKRRPVRSVPWSRRSPIELETTSMGACGDAIVRLWPDPRYERGREMASTVVTLID